MRDILRAEVPEASVSISAEVLREYREYERSVTTLVDAAGLALPGPDQRAAGRKVPPGGVSVMTSNGGMLAAGTVVDKPISTVPSGPAAGALGATLVTRPRATTASSPSTGAARRPMCRSCSTGSTHHRGNRGAAPAQPPMVGAGGGSVAWSPPRASSRSARAPPAPSVSELVFTTDVPEPVAALVAVVVPYLVTFAAGYMAKHTLRVQAPKTPDQTCAPSTRPPPPLVGPGAVFRVPDVSRPLVRARR
ncbi:MAG: hydantoinase/oxoprolinase family protein [Streptomycetales bacterium]